MLSVVALMLGCKKSEPVKPTPEPTPVEDTVFVEKVILSDTLKSVLEGESFKLNYTLEPADGYYKSITWTSSNAEVATVDSVGNVKALKEGEAIVKIAVDKIEAQCKVFVNEEVIHVENVVLNETSIELMEDDTFQLSFTVEPEDAEYETVTWTSSNPDVATVDENGLVTAISEGNAGIKVTVDDVEAACNVKVNAKPQGFALDIQITNITPNNADVTIVPNDETKTYYVYGMTKAKYDVESTYSELGIFGYEYSWYSNFGSEWISYMLADCKTGTFSCKATDFKKFIQYGTEFVVYAYGFDEGGAPTTEVFTNVFSTSPMNPANNDITVTVNQTYTNGVNATFHTTNSTQYYVTLQRKTYVEWWQQNGTMEEMLFDALEAENEIRLLSGDATIQPDGYYVCYAADTDYYIIYCSYDEQNGIRGEVRMTPFHTAAN